MVQGVIFDLDGLLLETEMIYYQANQQIADKMGIPFSKEVYLRYLGLSDEELWKKLHEDFSEFGKENVQLFIDESYKLTKHLFATKPVPVKKGAYELLNWLKGQKIPAVVASSNTKKAVHALLEKNQLNSYFVKIFSADDVSLAKPHPEIVEKAAHFLAFPKENLLMLEDSLNGIKAANGANVPVFLVPDLLTPTEEMIQRSTKVFNNLLEVKDFLASH